MFKFFGNALKSYIVDENEPSLYERIKYLEYKITLLQEENIEINNLLYETLNSIDAIDARIDILAAESYNSKSSFPEK
jgi:uncharacterized coiled-coil protein SlyX